jgi:hypothetical protein
MSGLVYVSSSILAGIAALAISGAIFSGLGLRADSRPAGRVAIGAALAIGAMVIVASLLMAGRWGGPA